MPKALFLSESQGWSGGAAQLLALAMGLRARDWDVRLASPEDGEVAKRARAAGVPHIPFHPRQDYDLFSAHRLAKIVAADGIDILHAHHPRAHAVGLASLYLGSRRPVYLVTRRVSFKPAGNPFSKLKYRNPRINAFIAVAENVRQTLISAGVPAERVRTIPSGVDTEEFKPRGRDEALRAELGLTNGAAVIAKIGNYGAWKGQDIFLSAAARLLKSGRKAVFLMAGRDTDSATLKAKAAEVGLPESSLRLLGFRRDVSRLLSICDISVNAATKGEGISGAIRESLSMEIPVVASNAGGNAELVREGVTGKLCEAGSSESLAEAIGAILDNPDSAKRLAKAGAEIVQNEFSVERMVDRTAAFYTELMQKR